MSGVPSEWQRAKNEAEKLVAWRRGWWPKQARAAIRSRLGEDAIGPGMSLEEKLELLADIVATIHDEGHAHPAPVDVAHDAAETRAYALYRTQLASSRRAA